MKKGHPILLKSFRAALPYRSSGSLTQAVHTWCAISPIA